MPNILNNCACGSAKGREDSAEFGVEIAAI